MKRIRLVERHPTPDKFRPLASDNDDTLYNPPGGDSKWLTCGAYDVPRCSSEQIDLLQDVRELQLSTDENAADQSSSPCTRTPELCSCAIGSDASGAVDMPQPKPLFSLFRPAVIRKIRKHTDHAVLYDVTQIMQCRSLHLRTLRLITPRSLDGEAQKRLAVLDLIRRIQRIRAWAAVAADQTAIVVLRPVLVVIRHGESEYNAAVRRTPGWQDPKIFDPSLTALGCQQALRLRVQLASELSCNPSLAGCKDILWVTSPLRRCLQTFAMSCPELPGQCGTTATGAAGGAAEQIAERLRELQGVSLPRIKVVSCISERVLTYGDIGTPKTELSQEFGPLKSSFADLQEGSWWHGGSKNCKAKGCFSVKENSADFKTRVAAAKRWLERQPERVVFMYGHSMFWKSFFSHSEALRNCEYRILHW